MQYDSFNPYSAPASHEPVIPSTHKNRIAWYTAILLAICTSGVALFYSVLLTNDAREGNILARSVPALDFILYGYGSALIPVCLVVDRSRFLQLTVGRQWYVAIAFPTCLAFMIGMLFLLARG